MGQTAQTVEFFVPGIPRPGGSKKGFYNPKLVRVMMVKAGGQSEENWRQAVSYAAMKAMGQAPLLDGPVRLDVTFVMPRPKYHFHTSRKLAGQLRQDAPRLHDRMPDRTKLPRGTEDALKGILWHDDGQVCSGFIRKVYGDRPGALIRASKILSNPTQNSLGTSGQNSADCAGGHPLALLHTKEN